MAALLARIYERPLWFGESDLARSLSHLGDGSRLRRVMNKLVKGALVHLSKLAIHPGTENRGANMGQHLVA